MKMSTVEINKKVTTCKFKTGKNIKECLNIGDNRCAIKLKTNSGIRIRSMYKIDNR